MDYRLGLGERMLCGWLLSVMGAVTLLAESPKSLSLQTFDVVWETVNESYYDPEFGGKDWEAIGTQYREKAAAADGAEALRPILNDMLAELGESHFGVIPSSDDWEEAAMVEEEVPAKEPAEANPKEEVAETSEDDAEPSDAANSQAESDAGADSPSVEETSEDAAAELGEEEGAPSGDYSGVHVRLVGKQVVVSAVDKDSPAEKAGVCAGMVVRKVGALDVATLLNKAATEAPKTFSKDFFVVSMLGDLTGMAANDEQSLTVTEPNGRREQVIRYRPITYPGKMSVSFANLPSMPLQVEKRRIEVPRGEVLYLSFNIFLIDVMAELRKSIRSAGADENVVGMIIDLRGNPGGVGAMASGLAGLLTDEEFSLGEMTMRAGNMGFVAFPQKKAFLGPLAILVDRMSGSTSEIFAAGLQEIGRARVFGRRTMGAALPSFIRDLPNGDRLQYAIANFTTPENRRVEGRGVIPDVTVELLPKRLRRGDDPDLKRAMRWLQRQASRKQS